MDKRGDFGIGTLTIFIAMILVGAVAAGVLIQTATSTQQQALATGEESEKELVTMLRIAEVSGTDGSDGSVENITLTAKLAAGSNPIKFEDLLVQLDTDTFTAHFTYLAPLNNTQYCNASAGAQGCASIAQNSGSGMFTREFIKRGKNYYGGAVTSGDVVRITIAANMSLRGGEYYRIYIIPSHGTPDLIETNAPDVIAERYVALYP